MPSFSLVNLDRLDAVAENISEILLNTVTFEFMQGKDGNKTCKKRKREGPGAIN